LSVVSFCHSKNTSARGESCTLTELCRRHLPSDECWEKGCACGGARGGGVITRLKGEKGMSVVSFFHSKYTKQHHESCTLTRTLPCETGVTCLRQTLGEGTRARGGGVLTRLGSGEGHFLAAMDKKVISWPRACVVSTIFHENHPKVKIGRCSRTR
jgi:hypothetical protein